MELYKNPNIVARKSPVGGYGVFATGDVAAEDILEECHSINISTRVAMGGLFRDYRFWSTKEKTHYSIVFGYGSIFNSSETPNAYWLTPDSLDSLFIFRAKRDIVAGEEIFLDYHKSLRK